MLTVHVPNMKFKGYNQRFQAHALNMKILRRSTDLKTGVGTLKTMKAPKKHALWWKRVHESMAPVTSHLDGHTQLQGT